MKFDEGNKDNNSDSNLNNEPAPKAPEGGVGDSGASGAGSGGIGGGAPEKGDSGASAESAGGASAAVSGMENETTNATNETGGASGVNAGGDASIKTGEESSDDSKNIAAGRATMSFQTSENDGKNDNNNDKRKKKLIAAGVALAVLILAVAGWQYWLYTQTPFYKQTQMVKAIDESLKESEKWGGKTPEETVALFTEAIKKGDFELAGKYGNPEAIKPELEKMKADGKIDSLIKWLETGEIKMFTGGGDANLMLKENTQEFWILSMHKSEGGTWKIDEF